MGGLAWTEQDLIEVISKVQKESEGLPLHLIPENYYKDIPLPQYRYAVEAENKSLIEEDLEANSILPKEYHYMLCRSHEGFKWIGIQNDNNNLVSCIINYINKKPEDLPESYKLLPPNGTATSNGEWTFLDEYGNTANYPTFGVFIGYFSKNKSVQPAYNMLCFYKDLTQHYQNKYPEAGVKTVVISYTFKGFF